MEAKAAQLGRDFADRYGDAIIQGRSEWARMLPDAAAIVLPLHDRGRHAPLADAVCSPDQAHCGPGGASGANGHREP